MKMLPIEEAIGHRLACDVTEVTATRVRSLLTRDTLVEERHLPALRDAGHLLVYVVDDDAEPGPHGDTLDEVAASLAIAQALAGPHVDLRSVDAGKTFLFADLDGVVQVDRPACDTVNQSDLALVVTRSPYAVVRAQDLVAVVDVIPLTVGAPRLAGLVGALGELGPVVQVAPLKPLSVGLLVTGTEVYEGRIPDAAVAVVRAKVEQYGGRLGTVEFAPDDDTRIARLVVALADAHDVVVVTGGMSVDPTDRTPIAIGRVADVVLKYGLPVLPTAMSLVAVRRGTTILGVSSGIVHYRSANVLDRLLPLVFAGLPVTREYLVQLGPGGLMPEFLADMGRGAQQAVDAASP